MPGRHSKLTPDVKKRIVEALLAGSYMDDACAYAGISPPTAYAWLARGREGEQPFADFLNAVTGAQAKAIIADLAIIRTASRKGDWRAAAWTLEHRHPRKFGQHVRLELEREMEAILDKVRDAVPAETYERVLAALASDSVRVGETEAEDQVDT